MKQLCNEDCLPFDRCILKILVDVFLLNSSSDPSLQRNSLLPTEVTVAQQGLLELCCWVKSPSCLLSRLLPFLWALTRNTLGALKKFAECTSEKPSGCYSFNQRQRHQWTSLVAKTVNNMPAMQETRVLSLGWEDPLEKGMATNSSILAREIPLTEEPGRLHTVHGIAKSWARLSN